MFLVIKHAGFTVSTCIFIFHMFNLLISDVDQTWIWNLISFIYCALIIIVRPPPSKKNVHSCRFRHTPVFEYYINFLKCSLCNLSMVQFKIHSSFDNNKHINVYRIVHVLAFFFRQIPKCISHQFFKRPSKKWRFQHQSCGSCVPRQDRKSGQVHH